MDTFSRHAYEQARDQLLSHWNKQLYSEYGNIVYQRGVTLRRPLIRLEELRHRWGYWDPNLRTIVISVELILKHGWSATVEVLKHEMAHQLVDEVYHAREKHGPLFQTACRLLHVADWAIAAGGVIPEHIPHWKHRVVSPEEERLLRRVEKLLSLATSSNEHEALLAMQRVQEIYARHNIGSLGKSDPAEHLRLVIPLHRERVERAVSMVTSILIGHFFVRIVLGRAYNPATLRVERTVDILGTRENVLMAEYVYHFLLNQCEALWRAKQVKLKSGTGSMRGTKRDFILGVLSGFSAKLLAGQEEVLRAAAPDVPPATRHALIRQASTALDAYVKQEFPRLSSGSFDSSYRDADAFHAGRSEGQKLVLHRGVDGDSSHRGRLLKG